MPIDIPNNLAEGDALSEDWVDDVREAIIFLHDRLVAVTLSVDFPSINAGATAILGIAAPAGTAEVGDFAVVVGPASSGSLVWWGGGPVTVADELPVRATNPTGSAINAGASNCSWLVFRIDP